MEEINFTIPNISCMHCVHTIKSELSEIEGVRRVDGSAESKQVTIQFEAPATIDQIVKVLTAINYPPA